MKFYVNNYRAIESAEIVVDRIVILQGPNKAGKSSVFWSIRSVLLDNAIPDPRFSSEQWTLKDLSELCRDGKPAACRWLLSDDPGAPDRVMVWPDGKSESKGRMPHVTSVAAGWLSSSIAAMTQRERTEALGTFLCGRVRAEDFNEALEGIDQKTIDAVTAGVAKLGWAATLTRAEDRLRDLKRDWSKLTGTPWGERKMLEWRPEGWSSALEGMTIEAAQAAIDRAASDVEAIMAGQTIAISDIANLKTQADQLPAFRKTLEECNEKVKAAEEAYAKSEERQRNLKPTEESLFVKKCPHCDEEVAVTVKYDLLKPESLAGNSEELRKRRLEHAGADGEIERLRVELNSARRAQTLAERDVEVATKAADSLIEMGDINPNAIAEAKTALTIAQATFHAVNNHAVSTRLTKSMVGLLRIAAALAPEGIRKKVITRELTEFNQLLAGISSDFKLATVRIDPADFQIYIGDIRYRDEADSEQLRARIVLQVATALVDGSPIVLIDNDVDMDKVYYGNLVAMLLKRGLHAIIAVRKDSKKECFNTSTSKSQAIRENVRSYWIENGTAMLLTPEDAEPQTA